MWSITQPPRGRAHSDIFSNVGGLRGHCVPRKPASTYLWSLKESGSQRQRVDGSTGGWRRDEDLLFNGDRVSV